MVLCSWGQNEASLWLYSATDSITNSSGHVASYLIIHSGQLHLDSAFLRWFLLILKQNMDSSLIGKSLRGHVTTSNAGLWCWMFTCSSYYCGVDGSLWAVGWRLVLTIPELTCLLSSTVCFGSSGLLCFFLYSWECILQMPSTGAVFIPWTLLNDGFLLFTGS